MIGGVEKQDLRGRGDQRELKPRSLTRQPFFQEFGEHVADEAKPTHRDRDDRARERHVAGVEPGEARRNGVRGETLIETMAALHDVADDVGGGEARRQPGNLRGFGLPHRFGGHEALPGPLTRRFGPGGN